MSTYWISTTRWGELQVEAEERGEGWYARLAEPHDRLSAVKGAVSTTLDEALDNLAAGLERLGSDDPTSPRCRNADLRGPVGDGIGDIVGAAVGEPRRGPTGGPATAEYNACCARLGHAQDAQAHSVQRSNAHKTCAPARLVNRVTGVPG